MIFKNFFHFKVLYRFLLLDFVCLFVFLKMILVCQPSPQLCKEPGMTFSFDPPAAFLVLWLQAPVLCGAED